MKLSPYIMFPGNAEEALNFYKKCFNGEIKYLGRYGDSPMESPQDHKQKVMHSTFVFSDSMLMASDSFPGQKVSTESNIHLSVDVEDIKKMEKIFNDLSEGGQITMPLQDTFWGARFGMLKDKFGINWMLNCEKK